jgi:site-specific recombinase XerD
MNLRLCIAGLLRARFFGDHSLADIDAKRVTDYRNHRKAQPSRKNPTRKIKGTTVNREMAYMRCMFNFAIERRYLSDNPTSHVRPFDERRERPAMPKLSLEDEQRILENAPPYLRVAIVHWRKRVAVPTPKVSPYIGIRSILITT